MLFGRDAYRTIVRVVMFQSCQAFLTAFLKGHRLASPKTAHQVHTIEQADEHAVHTNPPPACAVTSHRDGVAHPRGIASGRNEPRLYARARGQSTMNLDFFALTPG